MCTLSTPAFCSTLPPALPPSSPHSLPPQSFELTPDQLRVLALSAADHCFLDEAGRAALRKRMEVVLSQQSARLAQPKLSTPSLAPQYPLAPS